MKKLLIIILICSACGSAKPYVDRKQYPTYREIAAKEKDKKNQRDFLTFGIIFMALMIAYGESHKRN